MPEGRYIAISRALMVGNSTMQTSQFPFEKELLVGVMVRSEEVRIRVPPPDLI